MKRIGIVTIGFFFYAMLIQAQPRVAVLLDSLQRGQTLSKHTWQYHAGDNMRRASLSFDDRNWLPCIPYFNRDSAPPGWQGIGWDFAGEVFSSIFHLCVAINRP